MENRIFSISSGTNVLQGEYVSTRFATGGVCTGMRRLCGKGKDAEKEWLFQHWNLLPVFEKQLKAKIVQCTSYLAIQKHESKPDVYHTISLKFLWMCHEERSAAQTISKVSGPHILQRMSIRGRCAWNSYSRKNVRSILNVREILYDLVQESSMIRSQWKWYRLLSVLLWFIKCLSTASTNRKQLSRRVWSPGVPTLQFSFCNSQCAQWR